MNSEEEKVPLISNSQSDGDLPPPQLPKKDDEDKGFWNLMRAQANAHPNLLKGGKILGGLALLGSGGLLALGIGYAVTKGIGLYNQYRDFKKANPGASKKEFFRKKLAGFTRSKWVKAAIWVGAALGVSALVVATGGLAAVAAGGIWAMTAGAAIVTTGAVGSLAVNRLADKIDGPQLDRATNAQISELPVELRSIARERTLSGKKVTMEEVRQALGQGRSEADIQKIHTQALQIGTRTPQRANARMPAKG